MKSFGSKIGCRLESYITLLRSYVERSLVLLLYLYIYLNTRNENLDSLSVYDSEFWMSQFFVGVTLYLFLKYDESF
jgi:hypothetical protein